MTDTTANVHQKGVSLVPKVYCEMQTTEGDKIEWFVSERRCYGRGQFFCYVYHTKNGEEVEDSNRMDPWPATNFPKSALVWQARCFGHDVPPTAKDIRWAKKVAGEKRVLAITKTDHDHYIRNDHGPRCTTQPDLSPAQSA